MSKIKFELADEKVAAILGEGLDGKVPSKEGLTYLAKQKGADVNFAIFQVARRICERNFGNKIFLYGFIYFSTYCKNLCTFCFYRKTNDEPLRYRKGVEEIIEAVSRLDRSGIHLVDLTTGEDPQMHEAEHYRPILEICREVKSTYELPVMISPGVIPHEIISKLSKIGVEWYALYQETHNRKLFTKLRPGQSYDARAEAKAMAKKEGLLIEDGILLGVGESEGDRIDSIFEMKALGAHQARVMGLEPQKGTPFESTNPPPILDEMRAIAMMRLVHQDRLIPASYDVDGLKGLELRIMAGANVVTSIIPPDMGFHGVAQPILDVDSIRRTVVGIKPYLNRLGLEPDTKQSYRKWVERERELLICR